MKEKRMERSRISERNRRRKLKTEKVLDNYYLDVSLSTVPYRAVRVGCVTVDMWTGIVAPLAPQIGPKSRKKLVATNKHEANH